MVKEKRAEEVEENKEEDERKRGSLLRGGKDRGETKMKRKRGRERERKIGETKIRDKKKEIMEMK